MLNLNLNGIESSTSSGMDHDMSHSNNSSDSPGRRNSSVSSSNLSSNRDGVLNREERCDKVRKYWEKKKRRKSQKYVRYECRKNLAEKRYRF